MAKRSISGVLLLDKPLGITSNKALQKVKYLYASQKSGHTGTLDPMATGMLPICMGEATKFSSVLLDASKTYEAVVKLGYQSSTGDAEGEIEKLSHIDAEELTVAYCEIILKQFIGEIPQMPPMYSALKYQGKPLYYYARKGEAIERQPRMVFIHDIRIKSFIKNELSISVRCGTGTYIRTLAEEIGKALGCGGAYLTQLRRSSIDHFDLSQARTLSVLEEMDMTSRDRCLMPIDSILRGFPAVTLEKKEAQYILQGRTLSGVSGLNDRVIHSSLNKNVRLYCQKLFLGLGEVAPNQSIKPKRLLSDDYLIDQFKRLSGGLSLSD